MQPSELAESVQHRAITDEYSFILQPSRIEGIGVFATHPIKRGTWLRLFAPSEQTRAFKRNDLPAGAEYFARYCLEKGDDLEGAVDFGRMSIGWYLNHSTTPNAGHKQYEYYALSDIAAGDEITIDYETL